MQRTVNAKKTAIICAIDIELSFYLDVMEDVTTLKTANLVFHLGKINGKEIIAVRCGVCKVNAAIATQILISEYKVDTVICSGVAGGIDSRLKIGDTVICTKAAYHDVMKEMLADYHPYIKDANFYSDENLLALFSEVMNSSNFSQKIYFGKIVTGEAFIDQEGRSEIIENHNPLCVDMETCAIAHVCYANSVPFIAVRSISDTEDESGLGSFEANCRFAAEKSFDVVMKLLLLR